MLTAVEYLGKVGVGITGPEFFRADDDKTYVVKPLYNSVGKTVLISEIVAAALGAKLRLPFPPSDLIDLQRFSPCQDGGASCGFASLYITDARYATNENVVQSLNFREIAGVILFDHIFHNADRTNNRKNLIVAAEGTKLRLYALDHSHLFRTGCWTIYTLTKLAGAIRTYSNHLYGVLLRSHLQPADFSPYIDGVKALTAAEIAAALDAVPTGWFEDTALKTACRQFIEERCRLIEPISAAIFEKITAQNEGYPKS